MTDDEDDRTPRGWVSKRPGRAMTSDDRALAHRVRTNPLGVPIPETVVDQSNDTNPFDIFDPARPRRRNRPSDSVVALANQLREDRRDPYELIAEAAFEVVDMKREHRKELEQERSANAQREIDTETVLQGPRKAHKATRRNLIAAVIAAAASIGAAAKQWVGHDSDRDRDRIEQMEKSIDRIDIELRAVRLELSHLSPRENFR